MLLDKDLEGLEKSPTQRDLWRHFAPIDCLPEEIFMNIIQLSINADTAVRDLLNITTVCQRWKRILEGAPALWSSLTAAEGVDGLRRALRMVQHAPLDLKFDTSTSTVDLETFFQETSSRISQWRTLLVKSYDWSQGVSPTCPASTAPPRLELLYLIYYSPGAQRGEEIALFGGQPAPVSLKDVRLEWVPVAVAPLRLSGLTSLVLDNLPNFPVEEILRILQESPELEYLRLSWWQNSTSQNQFSGDPGTSQDAIICLTSLRSLTIDYIPISHIHLLLSVLRFPNLERFDLGGMIQDGPISDFFALNARHLIDVLQRVTSKADCIRFKIVGDTCSAVFPDGFLLQWRGPLPIRLDPIRAFFEWLFTHLGAWLKEIPTTLSLRTCPNHLSVVEWFSANLKITELWLYGDLFHADRDPNELVPFLSRPVALGSATCPPQWLFPSLEVFCSSCPAPVDVTCIATMVQERHSAIGDQDMPGIIPKPFRKIMLDYGGPTMFVNAIPINEEALTTIKRESRGAEVYWADNEWTRT
ncbi:hypothetical protein FS837_008107 [Tulasnella sp. UAMH 9824]|nr:hypothetical protein FS837_008107 [Tulasnella sp. UAMH 9824]